MALDGARPGDNRQLVSANRGVAHPHDGFLRAQVEPDKFVRFADANGIGHARQVFKARRIDCTLIARDADGRAGRARHRVRFESQFGDDVTDMRNLRIGGVGFHDN